MVVSSGALVGRDSPTPMDAGPRHQTGIWKKDAAQTLVVERTRNIDIFYAKFPFCIKNIQVNRLKTEVFKQKIMCDHPKHRTIELVDKVAIFVNRVSA